MTIQVQETFTAWPVAAAGMTILGAYGGVLLTNYVTRRREQAHLKEKHVLDQKLVMEKHLQEQQASEERRRTDLQFISIELIFLLEAFAEKCADVACDYGEPVPPQGEHTPAVMPPVISFPA